MTLRPIPRLSKVMHLNDCERTSTGSAHDEWSSPSPATNINGTPWAGRAARRRIPRVALKRPCPPWLLAVVPHVDGALPAAVGLEPVGLMSHAGHAVAVAG